MSSVSTEMDDHHWVGMVHHLSQLGQLSHASLRVDKPSSSFSWLGYVISARW